MADQRRDLFCGAKEDIDRAVCGLDKADARGIALRKSLWQPALKGLADKLNAPRPLATCAHRGQRASHRRGRHPHPAATLHLSRASNSRVHVVRRQPDCWGV